MKFLIIVVLACCSTAIAKSVGGRIVGGSVASSGQFPYQVSLRQNNQHFCGGSIISQNTILTAGHCFYGFDINGVTVVVGTNTLNGGGVAHTVAQVVVHESYNSTYALNDIAIVRVEEPIVFNSKVQRINMVKTPTSAGSQLTVTGWGLTSYPGSIPNDLMYLGMKSIDLQTCATSLNGIGVIGTGHVCTSTPVSQGTCQGDSGGPLVNENGEQVGIVSWGYPCAKGYPDVFTSVEFYGVWIWVNA